MWAKVENESRAVKPQVESGPVPARFRLTGQAWNSRRQAEGAGMAPEKELTL